MYVYRYPLQAIKFHSNLLRRQSPGNSDCPMLKKGSAKPSQFLNRGNDPMNCLNFHVKSILFLWKKYLALGVVSVSLCYKEFIHRVICH